MIAQSVQSALRRAAGPVSAPSVVNRPEPTMSICPKGTVITARLDAVNGDMTWQSPAMSQPCLLDIVLQGHAAIRFDGNRAPRMKKCVGCSKQSTFAWHVHPINFVVPGCNADHVADAIEKLWGDAVCVRIRGDQAKALIHPVDEVAA